jgi:hypothetical protein
MVMGRDFRLPSGARASELRRAALDAQTWGRPFALSPQVLLELLDELAYLRALAAESDEEL